MKRKGSKMASISADDLRQVRERLNETQTQFADRLGINQGTISRWENTGPPAKGVTAMWLQRVLQDIDRVYPTSTKR